MYAALERNPRSGGWLDVAQFAPLIIESCDAFNIGIAALSSRAVSLGLYEPPTEGQLRQARVEGWIAPPTGKFKSLCSWSPVSGS